MFESFQELCNRIFRRIKSYTYYLLSYRKSDWELDDYPIRYEFYEKSKKRPAFWNATIIGWVAMWSSGKTRKDAFQNLKRRFLAYKNRGDTLYRPGIDAPIKWASTTEVSKYRTLSIEFFEKILNITNNRWWISDQSSLWVMVEPEARPDVIKRIQERYGVDISDIEDGNFVTIFKRITGQ
jgi:hypothetical protein